MPDLITLDGPDWFWFDRVGLSPSWSASCWLWVPWPPWPSSLSSTEQGRGVVVQSITTSGGLPAARGRDSGRWCPLVATRKGSTHSPTPWPHQWLHSSRDMPEKHTGMKVKWRNILSMISTTLLQIVEQQDDSNDTSQPVVEFQVRFPGLYYGFG